MVDLKLKQKNSKYCQLQMNHMILVFLTKEFKTTIAKGMYKISGSVSLSGISDENAQCRKKSRFLLLAWGWLWPWGSPVDLYLLILHCLWLFFAGWLSYFGLAPYLTYGNGISRFEQSPEISCSCQSNSLPTVLNTFVFNVAEMTKTQKFYNLE